ncbi:hypothetical protein [Halorubrum sp. C191]|uniref:hypothetical protein n=1 Tax=Halorubrum sp. C191 TaxID=1383842 RepID=UPI00118193EE|nr:hypothetical protein [Halorubrum sp. C191]
MNEIKRFFSNYEADVTIERIEVNGIELLADENTIREERTVCSIQKRMTGWYVVYVGTLMDGSYDLRKCCAKSSYDRAYATVEEILANA